MTESAASLLTDRALRLSGGFLMASIGISSMIRLANSYRGTYYALWMEATNSIA